ncbi:MULTISPECIES: hypothetical protein [Metabacillus]|uniref:hypothetical protein n=1 Tax=Metabacillus TaxID=2675233 RepID=UPI000C7FCCDA|nr:MULTISPECIES: hypothetical protein [Metabacillus]MCM3443556.1 hypothetical protein [Metabacillus halosaccharovorans]PMC35022.1 hypothetical protein CJ195_21190 [Bacillus sp. UMB0899]
MLVNKIEELFKPAYMKERLFTMLKNNGEFIRTDSNLGFLYAITLGNSESKAIRVEVAMKSRREITILNASISDIQLLV